MHGFKPCSCIQFYKLNNCPDKFRSAQKCWIHLEFSPSGSSWIHSELVILVGIWSENLALLQPFEVKKNSDHILSRSTQIWWVNEKTSKIEQLVITIKVEQVSASEGANIDKFTWFQTFAHIAIKHNWGHLVYWKIELWTVCQMVWWTIWQTHGHHCWTKQ